PVYVVYREYMTYTPRRANSTRVVHATTAGPAALAGPARDRRRRGRTGRRGRGRRRHHEGRRRPIRHHADGALPLRTQQGRPGRPDARRGLRGGATAVTEAGTQLAQVIASTVRGDARDVPAASVVPRTGAHPPTGRAAGHAAHGIPADRPHRTR